jgi:hypothetical protein
MGVFSMIVGVAGHQKRVGIDWDWVSQAISTHLSVMPIQKALSSLAEGTDQVFADAAIDLGIAVVAIIPLDDYERFFSQAGLTKYRDLLQQCTQVSLHWSGDPEHAFLNAGRYIVDSCDLLVAVWDGQPADGLGGTADIVLYAKEQKRTILHLNPCDQTVHFLQS